MVAVAIVVVNLPPIGVVVKVGGQPRMDAYICIWLERKSSFIERLPGAVSQSNCT